MKKIILSILTVSLLIACKSEKKKVVEENPALTEETTFEATTVETAIGMLNLPAPFETESAVKIYDLQAWPEGELPKAPAGFTVTKYADGFENPRWTYVAPNNDIFVVESGTRSSANKITLLRDKNNDGTFEVRETFLDELNQPFGMLVVGNSFYVANTDGLYQYPYKEGQTNLTGVTGEKIVDLPAGGYNNHWTRNIITNKAKDKIYISVGSASNVAEHGMEEEIRRANILEVNLDGSGEIIYGSGLRNPVGMDWNPVTGDLWTAVNERDKLGDELVPDYATSVKKGGFYGWPYSYYGQINDPRMEGKGGEALIEKAIVPDVPLGPHTASLGFTFYTADQFPTNYKNGAFVGQHGSWNRSTISGYKVVFIPFENGKPQPPQDFLTGFIANLEEADVYGRPVGVTTAPDGSLLVNDDTGNAIWKVSYSK